MCSFIYGKLFVGSELLWYFQSCTKSWILLQAASILVLFLKKLHFSWKAYEDMMTQESTEVQSPHGICQILNRTNFLYLVFLWSFKTPFSLLTQQICSVFSRASRPIFVLHLTDLYGVFLELQDPYSLLTQHICSVFFLSFNTHFLCWPNKFIQFFFWSSKTHSLSFT